MVCPLLVGAESPKLAPARLAPIRTSGADEDGSEPNGVESTTPNWLRLPGPIVIESEAGCVGAHTNPSAIVA